MQKLDVLNRETFVEQLVNLTENISANKKSTSFAINGVWGSGKSFVLDMYEDRLNQIQSEDTATDKYFVIRYNCWKYDYYEEPLIAIVAAMIDTINQKTKLIPDGKRKEQILGVLKAIGASLLYMANDSIKDRTGVDLKKLFDVVKVGAKAGEDAYKAMHDYDMYFSFNLALESLQKLIQDISSEYAVVFLIDELDRCLPEYSIKVLERLHHLTEKVSNVITVISIDKQQLKKSIESIFGFNTPDEYLKKFIQFEIQLDKGVVSEKITEKYADYISLFDESLFEFPDSVEEFWQAIFKDVDARTHEQLVERVMIAHKMLYPDKKDYVFMCMELLLAVLICVYNDNSCFTRTPIKLDSWESIFITNMSSQKPAFSTFFKEKLDLIYFTQRESWTDIGRDYILPEHGYLYGAILLVWYWMHEKNAKIYIRYNPGTVYAGIADHSKELKKFAETIKMIK